MSFLSVLVGEAQEELEPQDALKQFSGRYDLLTTQDRAFQYGLQLVSLCGVGVYLLCLYLFDTADVSIYVKALVPAICGAFGARASAKLRYPFIEISPRDVVLIARDDTHTRRYLAEDVLRARLIQRKAWSGAPFQQLELKLGGVRSAMGPRLPFGRNVVRLRLSNEVNDVVEVRV